TAHGELVARRHLVRDDDAAIVDPAVAAGCDAVVDLQFEIRGRAAPPDDEGVALDGGFGSDFADHGAVRDAPVFRVTVPAAQCLAVENGCKPRFIADERLRPVALFWHVRRLTGQIQTGRACD